jgi:hypothetical protein
MRRHLLRTRIVRDQRGIRGGKDRSDSTKEPLGSNSGGACKIKGEREKSEKRERESMIPIQHVEINATQERHER